VGKPPYQLTHPLPGTYAKGTSNSLITKLVPGGKSEIVGRAVASATPPADLNTDVTKDVEFWKKIGSHLSSETLSEDDFKALKDDLIFERLDENDKAGIEEELSSLIMPVDPNQDRGIEIS